MRGAWVESATSAIPPTIPVLRARVASILGVTDSRTTSALGFPARPDEVEEFMRKNAGQLLRFPGQFRSSTILRLRMNVPA